MATSKKMQERKKKKKEQLAKERVLKNRALIQAQAKHEKFMEFQAELQHEERNGKSYPIINDPVKRQAFYDSESAKVQEQLTRNLKMLEEVEAMYLKEDEMRQTLNKELEEKGYTSLEEKMAYLNQETIKNQKTEENSENSL